MDNDLKLLDVINDPDALDQFLDYSAIGSGAQQNSFEGSAEEFFNFENGQILTPSTDNSRDIQWSYAPSASVSDAFFDPSFGSSATQITNVPVATLAPQCGPGSQVQNLPTGVLAINSTGNYSSQNVVQLQQTRNTPDQFSGAIVADNSLQRAQSVNKVVTNFAVASSAGNNSVILTNNVGATLAGNGGQMLMSVQPQTVVQNGAVRIQYVQVRNQNQPTMTQLQTNNLNPVQLQQQQGVQVSHGVPGGINLQGARFLIQTGNQSVSGNRAGHSMNLQQMQVSTSNLVGITQGTGLQQGNMLQQGTILQQGNMLQQGKMLQQGAVVQHGTVIQQGTMLQQGTGLQQRTHIQQARLPTGAMVGRANSVPMTGQVVDSNLNLSSGGQMVLQRTSGQNVVFQTLQSQHQQQQQQHSIALPQQQDGKLPDGLVVQIGGQIYRFEQTHQATGGVAVPMKQGTTIYPQGGEFGEGGGVAHDPVKMLQQNVQLQQMLIGNQMNVLQLLQQQQQRQQQTTGNNNQETLQTNFAPPSVSKNFVVVGQQFVGSQASNSGMMVVAPHQASGGVVVNPMEVTGASSGLGSMPLRPAFASPVLHSTLEKTVLDPSSTMRPGSAPLAMTSVPQASLQFIQPKPPLTSVSVMRGVTSGISNFGSATSSRPVNVVRPGNGAASVQQMNVRLSSAAAVSSVAPSLPVNQQAPNSGTLQGPQNVQPVVGMSQSLAPAGQSQMVTTVQLSSDQQNLLTKIQSQMKVLLDLQKRNPDQEKYLQMLITGQQRIISQGVAQYLQQQKINNSAASSGGTPSQVTVARPLQSAGTTVEATASLQTNSGEILATGASMTSGLSSVTATSSAHGQPSSSSSGLQNSGAPVKAEDLFKAFPYLKEKLEAQLSKMPPEQRQWFAKNQSVVFAKLQHHHRLLQERDKLQQQQQQQQQPPKHLASSAQQISTETVAPPSDATATRVIRSLHLTRAQKFHLYLQKDQKRATHPESSKPFENFKDVIRSLVPYHVFQTREPPAKDVAAVEEAFEEKSHELLNRKDSMLRKYRHLLWEEAMRPQLTSEMVLLERAFHNDEKTLLLEEKRQAEEDPDSFVPRPVLKRLKLEDDIKKEEEDDDECKDKDKVDFESRDKDYFLKAVKAEDSSAHSSPSNADSKTPSLHTPISRSSSVECYKSLQIKLEKLDGTESDTSKRWQVTHNRDQHSLNLHISARNVVRTDTNNGEVDGSKNRQTDSDNWLSGTDAIAVAATSSSGFFPNLTEDDAAVASLLNTEQLTSCSFPTVDIKVEPLPCTSDVLLTERNQRFDIDDSVNTLDESMDSDSEDGLYADQVMSSDMGMVANAKDEEDDELMQGTIDSLMADLTQFNRDLSGSSWMGGETKSDTLNGSVGRTGNQSESSKYNSPLQASTSSIHEDSDNSSLQHEIQCAINSIIRLQQPWSDSAGGSKEMLVNVPRSDDDESSLDAAVNSILL